MDDVHVSEASTGGQDPMPETEPATVPNLLVRIVQVFVSPGTLFEALKNRPVWLDALLVLAAISLVSTFFVSEEITREAIRSGSTQELTEEQLDGAVEILSVWGKVLAVIVPPLFIAGLAGIATLIFSVLLGDEIKYRQLLSAVTHAWFIPTLGGLIALAIIISTGDATRTLGLNLLVPGLDDGYLFRFLRGLNVFYLWMAVVLGIAINKLSPKRSAGSAGGVFVSLFVGLAAVFALFGGG